MISRHFLTYFFLVHHLLCSIGLYFLASAKNNSIFDAKSAHLHRIKSIYEPNAHFQERL
jgi:hypothetical protein